MNVTSISKTQFKEYTKCHNFAFLDYLHNTQGMHDDDRVTCAHILKEMFSEEGEDLVDGMDEAIDVMLPYYKLTEKYGLIASSIALSKPFEYYEKTSEQKRFSFVDENGIEFYTYVDGYYENDDEIIIIEVKATNSKDKIEVSSTKKKVEIPLFIKEGKIFKVKDILDEIDYKSIQKCLNRFDEKAGKYFYDVAITSFIVSNDLKRRKINKKVKYYLCCLNRDFSFNGKYINGEPDYFNPEYKEQLFNIFEVNKVIEGFQDRIISDWKLLSLNIKNDALEKKYYPYCKKCQFDIVCNNELTQPDSVRTLLNKRSKVNGMNVVELINNKFYLLKSIPDGFFDNPVHKMQIDVVKNKNDFIDRDELIKEINKIEYPIYHLDFESLMLPLPRFKGEWPNEQSLFQFSIHVEKEPGKCNRYKDNYYFLPDDFGDHRRELIEKMISIIDLSHGGSVLVYNKTFECSRIKELAKLFPEYAKELMKIHDSIKDLEEVLEGRNTNYRNFYSYNMQGSYSIKKVLPVFTNLKYQDISIHNGIQAYTAYCKFTDLPQEEIEEIRKKLIEYCGLDTYSMVAILNNLKKRINA